MVTSPNHFEDINRAPLDVLSLHAVAKDFLRPKETMHGFEWKDIRGIEGTGFVRALRTILTGQLPELLPTLKHVVTTELDLDITKYSTGTDQSVLPLYSLCKRLVAKVNATVFFGSVLTQDAEFFEAAMKFPHESAYAAEIIRLTPQGLGKFIARMFTENYKSSATLHRRLSKEIRDRLQARAEGRQGIQELVSVSPNE
jgi:hypothetical protein